MTDTPPSSSVPNAHSGDNQTDATAILRDEVLITALAKGILPLEHREDRLACALWEWRDDLANAELSAAELKLDEIGASLRTHSEAARAANGLTVIHGQDALGQINADSSLEATEQETPSSEVDELAVRRSRRGLRLSRRAAIGAAIVAFGVASIGSVAAASVAEPGSVLWPLAKVVNKDRAQSLEARQAVREQLASARIAAGNRDQDAVKEYLRSARDETGRVRAKDGQGELRAEVQQLEQQLASPEAAAVSETPAPTSSTDPSATPTSTPSASTSPLPSPSPTSSASVSPSAAPTSTSVERSEGPSKPTSSRGSASGSGGSVPSALEPE